MWTTEQVFWLCMLLLFIASFFSFVIGGCVGSSSKEAEIRKYYKLSRKTQKECENEGITYYTAN